MKALAELLGHGIAMPERTPEEAMRILEEFAERDRAVVREGMAGAPLRYAHRTVDDLRACCPAHQRVIDIAQRYVEKWPDVRRKCSSLVFWGGIGTTKTVTATAIGQGIARLGVRAAYTTINALVLRVKETWRPGATETETAVLASLAVPELLVIDEIGRQKGSETELLTLAQVIDRRYELLKPTLLISNLPPTGITERIGEAAMSRIRQGGMVLHFDWPDQRAEETAR